MKEIINYSEENWLHVLCHIFEIVIFLNVQPESIFVLQSEKTRCNKVSHNSLIFFKKLPCNNSVNKVASPLSFQLKSLIRF